MAGGVTFKLDSSKVEAEMKRQMKAMERMDDIIEDFCKDVTVSARLRVPVDTGKLKWSIRYVRHAGARFEISADAPYAGYVEYGTRKMRAQPYLRPAVNVHLPKLRARIKKELDG